MTIIAKWEYGGHSEMIIKSSFCNDVNYRHFQKSYRFVFDLFEIYFFIFKWYRDHLFGMRGWLSFWNDGVPFGMFFLADMTSPLLSEMGGFTSNHIERKGHFFIKNGWFSGLKLEHWRRWNYSAWIFEWRAFSGMKIITKSFRNFIISEGQIIF